MQAAWQPWACTQGTGKGALRVLRCPSKGSGGTLPAARGDGALGAAARGVGASSLPRRECPEPSPLGQPGEGTDPQHSAGVRRALGCSKMSPYHVAAVLAPLPLDDDSGRVLAAHGVPGVHVEADFMVVELQSTFHLDDAIRLHPEPRVTRGINRPLSLRAVLEAHCRGGEQSGVRGRCTGVPDQTCQYQRH